MFHLSVFATDCFFVFFFPFSGCYELMSENTMISGLGVGNVDLCLILEKLWLSVSLEHLLKESVCHEGVQPDTPCFDCIYDVIGDWYSFTFVFTT
jgi:hypothetical protein